MDCHAIFPNPSEDLNLLAVILQEFSGLEWRLLGRGEGCGR